MVGRGAFRFGRSSPPRFPAHTEGVGSRLRCLAESRETTAEGPPGSDGRRWTAAVATRKAGMDCPKISISALDWRRGRGSGVAPISSSMLPPDMLRREIRTGAFAARRARFKSAVRATSCLGAVCMARGHQAVGYRYRIRRQITTQDLREDWRVATKRFAANRVSGCVRVASSSVVPRL